MLGFWDDEELVKKYNINKEHIVEWVLLMQVAPFNDEDGRSGFRGGSFLSADDKNEQVHVAMTYTALCTLALLAQNDQHVWEKLDQDAIIRTLKSLQNKDGSFQCIGLGSENDQRFLYCACTISYMLNDWSGVCTDKAVEYIRSCHSYDGAFSLIPGNEGHGGSTYCVVASLVLMDRLDDVLTSSWRSDLVQWCVSRQQTIHGGLQGRPNKAEDTCYSYWIGGTLHLLGSQHLIDKEALNHFVLECQTDMGGFSKLYNGVYPDLLHSFYSLAWLSIANANPLSKGNTIEFDDNKKEHSKTGSQLGSLNILDCKLGMCQKRTVAFRNAFPSLN